MEFFPEEEKQGGPPGHCTIGRAFGGGVGGKESDEAREVLFEPGLKGTPGGERRRLRDCNVFE